MPRTRYNYILGLRRWPSFQTIATAWSRLTFAGDATVPCTTKLRLLANRRRWGWPCMSTIDPMYGFFVWPTIATAIIRRVTARRRPCDQHHQIRFEMAQIWVGLYPTLK